MARPRKEKAPVIAGVGESPIFRDPNAPDPYEILRGCHVNGKPISELPEEVVAVLTFQHTDESIAQRNEGKVENAARVTQSELSKSIQERADFRESSPEPWEARDVMKEITDKYVAPGFKGKFLSPRKISRQGTRGHEVVRDERGDPVKLGEMILGQMPIEKVQRRNRAYQQKSQARLNQMKEEFQEGQQRIVRDAGERPSALGTGSRSADGLDSAFSE